MPMRNNLGNAFKDQGKLKEAIGFYRQAIEAKPNYANAHFNLGDCPAGRRQAG